MNPLSNSQFATTEAEIRKRGLVNPDKGFVGNGYWWGMYPSYYAAQSGYGGHLTAAQAEPVSDSGATASVGDPSGLTGMPSN